MTLRIGARPVGLALVTLMVLSSCGLGDRLTQRNAAYRVGLPFNANLQTGETNRDFTVTAPVLGASLEEARESLRFPATRHCIELSGFSEIDWVIDPATGDWAETRTENGDLTVAGRCTRR